MSIIPILTPKQMLSILLKAGFSIVRQKGSHIWLTNEITKRSAVVAMHAKDFSRKIISKILKQSGISIPEFIKLLKKK